MALEQGREVFAVPGSPLDPRAEGTNGLLKQGATLTTEAADVISVLRPIMGSPLAGQQITEPDTLSQSDGEPDNNVRARIVSLLGPVPVSLDELIRLSGTTPALVRMTLLELDIAGRLTRQPGGLVALIAPEE